jgi:hypothetical protein
MVARYNRNGLRQKDLELNTHRRSTDVLLSGAGLPLRRGAPHDPDPQQAVPCLRDGALQKAMAKLDAQKQSIAQGTTEDGLYIFIDFYINSKISEGYLVQKRDVTQSVSLSFKSWNLLSYGYNFIANKLFSKGNQPILWIVDVRRPFSIGELNKI